MPVSRFIVILALATVFGPAGNSVRAQPPAPPDDFLFLFLNPGVAKNAFTSEPQIRLAEAAGITEFTFLDNAPLTPDPRPGAWRKFDDMVSLFTSSSPAARIAPRIPMMSTVGPFGLTSAVVYQSGPSQLLCWTDPAVQEAAATVVRNTVLHCENAPWANQVWAYHLSGRETGEWIPEYRPKGADYSEANAAAFRQWLRGKYGTDANLRTAWGEPAASLATAGIPVDHDGRFPMNYGPPGTQVQTFYSLPKEQDWVDYSTFVSDSNARCIIHLAETAKAACGGKKAAIVFYGYIFELPSSICGHLRARDLLRSAAIDYVASPISYAPYSQRLEGGTGAPMSATDSFALHRKTWINEDDLHTHAQMPGVTIPDWYWDVRNPEYRVPRDAEATTGILERNLAFAAFHHTATWWMDLIGGGWFSDPALWKIWSGDFGRSMVGIRQTALPYHPDVAVVVDEESRFFEKITTNGFAEIYAKARNALQGSGASVGFYYLDDYLDGLVPPTAATVFLNAWHLDVARLAKLQARIAERKGTVIWQYAPGYMNPGAGGGAGIEQMTGIKVKADEGASGSAGLGALGSIKFGGGFSPDPRIVIKDGAAKPLGAYLSDHSVSAAMKTRDGVRQVLVTDCNWSAEFINALFKATGVPLVASRPAVVETSASAVYVYGTQAGTLHVNAPDGRAFSDGNKTTTVSLKVNEGRLLPLSGL